MKTKLILTLAAFTTLLLMITTVPNAFAYYREDWEDDVTQKTFVPVFVIYRPPGADSYQTVTTGVNFSYLTLKFTQGSCPVSSAIDTSIPNIALPAGLTTSSSDGIFGKKLTLNWHIWGYTLITIPGITNRITRAELRGLTDDNWAFVGRADLPNFEYKLYSLPDLRGTIGAFHFPLTGTITLGPGTAWEHNFYHTWPKTDNINLNAKISITYDIYPAPITAWFWTYWTTPGGSGNYTYQTHAYIRDPTAFLSFTINADAGSWGDPTTTIYDYIFWFNQY